MKKIEPLDFYLMRIPAFPINKLMDLNKIMDSNPSNDNTDKYITYFLEPFFLKAIYLSSKVLYKELIKFKNNELEDPKKKKKLVNSLYKYYVRMCTRPTPYGLFAGYFFGNAEDGETDIIINNDNLNPIINLDMAYLSHLQSFLIKNNNDIRFNEIFYSNNTLYALNNKFRYVNFTNSSGEKKYFLNEVSYSEMLEYIIDISKNGMTLNELLDNLSNNVDGGTNEQFQQYLNELINFNILVFEEINIYSEDNPGKQFYNRYKNFINVESIGNIKNLESNFSLKKIIKKEKELENLSKTKFKNYFNLTLNINTKSNRISSKVLDEISRNISDLKHLKNKTTPEDLLNFRKKFYKKYGSKEVPLNEALDFDIGLGYGLQVSENITEFPIINNVYSPKSKINTKYDLNLLKFLDKRLKDCLINNLYTIELDSNDIQEIKKRGLESEDHVENSYIMGAILSKSYKELDNGNYYFLAKTNMPSPYMGSLLARFDYVDKIGTNRIKNMNRFAS